MTRQGRRRAAARDAEGEIIFNIVKNYAFLAVICNNYFVLIEFFDKINKKMNTKRFVNFRYIFYPFLAFLFGIVVARNLYQGSIEVIVVTALLLLAFGGFLIFRKRYKILALLFAFFFIGNGFYYIGEATYYNKDYSGEVLVVGRVSDSFEESDYIYEVLLKDASINGENCRNIKVTFTKEGQSLQVGEIVSFESEVEAAKPFSLGSFNSSAYRSGTGYTAKANLSEVVISSGYTNLDEKIRLAIKEKLYQNMNEENAAVAYAVLFGDQSGIAFEIKDSYRNSGIIHILTVSGLNITFLIAIMFGFLKLLKVNKYVNFALTSMIIVLYSALCGFTPSVVRAAVMGIIMMVAMLSNRRYDSLNAMGIAGFLILIFSPLSAFDVGFLMSIACVCGIILLYPMFCNLFKKFMPNIIAQYIAISLSAQLAILPFLALFSSNLNLLSFIINLFIVPIFSVVFPWLFFASIICLIMPFMSFLLVPVGWGFTLTKYIALIFATTSLQIKLTPFAFSVIVFFFLFIYLISQFIMCKPINKFLLSTMSIFCITCCFGFTSLNKGMKGGVTYLNYNNEEAIILKNSDGQTMLIGDNYLVERYFNNENILGIDIYLSLGSITTYNASDLAKYTPQMFLCTQGEECQDNIIICQTNTQILAGNFEIVFFEANSKLVGANISYDGYNIFVASSENLDYNDKELFSLVGSFMPDIVFLGEDYYLAENSNYFSVSSNKNDITTLNFYDYGNFNIEFINGKFITRGLD